MEIVEKAKIYLQYPIIGSFFYEDKFQIIGKGENDNEGYYAILEIKFEKPEPYFRYSTENNTLAIKHIRINLWLLSLFTMFKFDKFELFEKYVANFSIIGESQIEKKNIKNYHDKNLDDRSLEKFYIPSYLKDLFSKYYNLQNKEKITFETILYLFNKATDSKEIGNQTISFTLLIMCVETIITFSENNNSSKCNSCGQEKYSVTKKFVSYMSHYTRLDDDSSIKLFKKMYSKRSGATHHGKLLSSDYYYTFEDNYHYFDEDYFLQKNTLHLVRIFIINWLISDKSFKYNN